MSGLNKKRITVLIVDVLIVLFALVGKVMAEVMIELLPGCPFNRYSLRCPSCGGTRAVYHLFNGELKAAFGYNQFFFLLTIYLFAVLILANLAYILNIDTCKRIFHKIANYKVIIVFAIIWLLFGVVRNLV